MLRDNIVFFTFFYSQESELFSKVLKIDVIKSRFSAKAFNNNVFFYAALTMLKNISIARTL